MIKERLIARKYAQALFEIDTSDERIDNLEQELSSFAPVFEENNELLDFFISPEPSTDSKRELVSTLTKKFNLSKDLNSLLLILLKRNKMSLLTLIREIFSAITRKARGEVEIRITTAVPVDKELSGKITDSLEDFLKKKVIPSFKVKKEILGGFIAEGDWTVIDMSTKGQLASFLERF